MLLACLLSSDAFLISHFSLFYFLFYFIFLILLICLKLFFLAHNRNKLYTICTSIQVMEIVITQMEEDHIGKDTPHPPYMASQENTSIYAR